MYVIYIQNIYQNIFKPICLHRFFQCGKTQQLYHSQANIVSKHLFAIFIYGNEKMCCDIVQYYLIMVNGSVLSLRIFFFHFYFPFCKFFQRPPFPPLFYFYLFNMVLASPPFFSGSFFNISLILHVLFCISLIKVSYIRHQYFSINWFKIFFSADNVFLFMQGAWSSHRCCIVIHLKLTYSKVFQPSPAVSH